MFGRFAMVVSTLGKMFLCFLVMLGSFFDIGVFSTVQLGHGEVRNRASEPEKVCFVIAVLRGCGLFSLLSKPNDSAKLRVYDQHANRV